jgi:hypothetical protein
MSSVNWFDLEAEFVSEDQSVDLGAVRMFLESGGKFIALKDGSFAEVDRRRAQAGRRDAARRGRRVAGQEDDPLPLFHATALDLLATFGDVEIEAKAKKRHRRAAKRSTAYPPVKAPRRAAGRAAPLPRGRALVALVPLPARAVGRARRRHGPRQDGAGALAAAQGEEGARLKRRCWSWRRPRCCRTGSARSSASCRRCPRSPGTAPIGKENIGMLQKVDVVLTSYALIRRDIDQLKQDEVPHRHSRRGAEHQERRPPPRRPQARRGGSPPRADRHAGREPAHRAVVHLRLPQPRLLGTLTTLQEDASPPDHECYGDADARAPAPRIHPFILRRLKTEVAPDLPRRPRSRPAVRHARSASSCALPGGARRSQAQIYGQIEPRAWSKSRIAILAALMRLRQVCCDPACSSLPTGRPAAARAS